MHPRRGTHSSKYIIEEAVQGPRICLPAGKQTDGGAVALGYLHAEYRNGPLLDSLAWFGDRAKHFRVHPVKFIRERLRRFHNYTRYMSHLRGIGFSV